MELKFVVPDMAETFGKLSYAGEGEILTEGYGRNTTVIGRSYHLYSSKQRADDIEVVELRKPVKRILIKTNR